ncbi:MAG: hypothetical protein HON04_06540 [Planctomicrobium sp.]|jgi:hypothetical protein|nr:hypothetical protein [Planctomicrobium sp.]
MGSNRDFFETLQKVLLRCWIAGFAILLVWFVAILGLSDTILQIHSSMFGITKHEFDLIMYCGMGLWKLILIVCFFLPWLSIKMVNRSVEG